MSDENHELAEKYAFLTPFNLLDDKHECQINENHNDIDSSLKEKDQNFIAAIKDRIQTWKEGPLEHLQFIQKYNIRKQI